MTPSCRLGSKWRIARSLRSMIRPGVSGPTSFILTMTFLPTASTRAYFGLNEGILRPRAILDPTKFLAQTRLDGSRPDRGIIALAGGCVRAALPPSGPERIVRGCCANDRIPGSVIDDGA